MTTQQEDFSEAISNALGLVPFVLNFGGSEVWRFRSTEVQKHGGSEVQRFGGLEVDR